jgi:hypothetical protein
MTRKKIPSISMQRDRSLDHCQAAPWIASLPQLTLVATLQQAPLDYRNTVIFHHGQHFHLHSTSLLVQQVKLCTTTEKESVGRKEGKEVWNADAIPCRGSKWKARKHSQVAAVE